MRELLYSSKSIVTSSKFQGAKVQDYDFEVTFFGNLCVTEEKNNNNKKKFKFNFMTTNDIN